jgi:hypothetical protein
MDVVSRNMTADSDGVMQLNSGADKGWAFGQVRPGCRTHAAERPTTRSGTSHRFDQQHQYFPGDFREAEYFRSDVPFNLYLTVNALSQNSRTENAGGPEGHDHQRQQGLVQM